MKLPPKVILYGIIYGGFILIIIKKYKKLLTLLNENNIFICINIIGRDLI
jgi:hypothetical protein